MSPLRLVVPLIACFAPLAAQQASDRRGESVRVLLTGQPGLHQVLAGFGVIGDHVVFDSSPGWESAKVVLEHRELELLRPHLPLGTLVAVLEESRPFRETVAAIGGPDGPGDPNYHTRAEVIADLMAFEQNHPTLAKVYDLQSRYGAPLTHDGFRIWALRISNAPDQDQDKPNIVVSANTHAGELATIEVPLFVADRLLTSYGQNPALTQLMDDNQIWILPNLNPDGLEYTWNANNLWRKNRRDLGGGVFGVDLNRNYPFFWGQCGSSTTPSSGTYRGPGAASEPEVQAMVAFAEAEGLERLLDFHCAGPDVRHPFNPLVVGAIPPMVRSTFDPLHNAIAGAMGYAVRGTCCCGTLMEWHYSVKGTMSFLVEFAVCTTPFSQTVNELNRAWPGIEQYLFASVPLTGHVTSSIGGQPLRAEITVAGQAHQNGQTVMSGGRFGRYHLWGGPGTYDVTFSALDHVPQTIRVTLAAGQTLVRDVTLTFGPTARHGTFGAGCPGSGIQPSSCLSLNSTGGTLAGNQSTNEYAYEVQAQSAISVTGFRLFTGAIGGAPTSVGARLYRATASGTPEAQAAASGTLNVGAQPGFYEVTLMPPTAIGPGETFFVAADTGSAFTSNLTSGSPGRAFWRRPPLSGSWAQSGIVQFPAWEVICSGGGGPGAVPELTSSGVPAIGSAFDVALSRAAPNTLAVLLLGESNAQWGAFALPLPLAPFGAPGCDLLVAGTHQVATSTDAMGDASLNLVIPNDTSLLGILFYDQYLVFDPAANTLGLAFSNGGDGVIGF